MATQVDVRQVTQIVRDALEFRQQALDGKTPGQQLPLADDLAKRIASELIPDLRKIFLDMSAIKVEWRQREFQAQLELAIKNNDYIAGYPAEVWRGWGIFMLELEAFLATPIASLKDSTPIDALMTRYIPGVKQVEVTLPPVIMPPVVNPPVVAEPIVIEEVIPTQPEVTNEPEINVEPDMTPR
jgi:hypothetical protein